MKISPATLDLVQRIARKLNEKSSVYGYAMVLGGQFVAAKYQAHIAQAVGIVSATAGVVLWLLSDTQVRYLLTGQRPADTKPPTVPPSQQG
ncbi:hypothetical protein [Dyella mobilis]|uniref:Uncharacterized protein n=1 Tax=Dyella mobilis TaxID=1849582 RepID=A0ABS2KKX8_9GAMM|nr:hypothetical protein [Dyella mobilis]MBM7131569.1 hypothetical protein [Dyella mobilis]GLQ96459.1 hypothetical protein GCM10007863_08770 [Dyella mobilis]